MPGTLPATVHGGKPIFVDTHDDRLPSLARNGFETFPRERPAIDLERPVVATRSSAGGER